MFLDTSKDQNGRARVFDKPNIVNECHLLRLSLLRSVLGVQVTNNTSSLLVRFGWLSNVSRLEKNCGQSKYSNKSFGKISADVYHGNSKGGFSMRTGWAVWDKRQNGQSGGSNA